MRLEKIKEIIDNLDCSKPFFIYIGKGENDEEIYLLNGNCSTVILIKSVEGLLVACNKKSCEIIWADPLPETPLLLFIAENLGIEKFKDCAYHHYLPEIRASAQRAGLQVKHCKKKLKC